MTFIVYSSDDEVIITTPEGEPQTLTEYFDKGGRDKDDYDREVIDTSCGFVIKNRLVVDLG